MSFLPGGAPGSAAAPAAAGRFPLGRWSVHLLTLFSALAAAAFAPFPRDDALITYQYATHIAAGHGFIYQLGDAPLLGTSAPLWALILALGARLHLAPATLAPLLGIAAHAACVPLAARLARRLGGSAPIAAAFTALFPPLVAIAASGMEAPVATALLLWAALATLDRRPRAATLAAAALPLLRLDLVPLLLLLGLAWRLRHGRWPLRPALAAFALQLPWWLYASYTFGSPIPHTVAAKLAFYSGAWPVGHILPEWFLGDPARAVLTLLAAAGAWWAACRASVASSASRSASVLAASPAAASPVAASVACVQSAFATPAALAVWLLALMPFAYFLLLQLSGTFPHEWYRTPPYPLHFAFVAVALGAICSYLARFRVLRRRGLRRRALIVAATLAAFLSSLALLPGTWSSRRAATVHWRNAHGAAGAWLAAHARPDETVACGDIGLIGARLAGHARLLDTVGLVSPAAVPYNRAHDYIGIYRDLRPEWAVIGTYGPLYRAIITAPAFRAVYREVARFPYEAGIDYVIYRRFADE